jgi:hypothetical protein
LVKAIRIEGEYFDGNRERMRYPEFRAKNMFVGSDRGPAIIWGSARGDFRGPVFSREFRFELFGRIL